MLHQNFMAEMFVGSEPKASYTPDGRFVVKFPACWSREADEKIWFDCLAWVRHSRKRQTYIQGTRGICMLCIRVCEGRRPHHGLSWSYQRHIQRQASHLGG